MKALKTTLIGLRHPHMGKFGPEPSGYIATFRQLQGVAVVAYCEDTDTSLLEPAGEFHRNLKRANNVKVGQSVQRPFFECGGLTPLS